MQCKKKRKEKTLSDMDLYQASHWPHSQPASFPPPQPPTRHPPSLQWPTCDHAESESYCAVDNLLTAAVHLMYRCVVRCGVSSGRRIPPAPSAQRKERRQRDNLEKQSCLHEDTLIILENKWKLQQAYHRWKHNET